MIKICYLSNISLTQVHNYYYYDDYYYYYNLDLCEKIAPQRVGDVFTTTLRLDIPSPMVSEDGKSVIIIIII